MRQRGVQPRLGEEDLRRWYLDEGLSTLEIARLTDMFSRGVHGALVRAGVPRRPLLGSELPIDDKTLEQLYVVQRIGLEELAAQFGVAPWAVRRRLRETGIVRPPGPPPGGDRPTPPRTSLNGSMSINRPPCQSSRPATGRRPHGAPLARGLRDRAA